MVKILDVLRIVITSFAFFFGYLIGFRHGPDPVAQLHFMIPMVITGIAGLSGLEGLFLPDQAAAAKGFERGSNYQRQSAIALLSYSVISILVCFLGWGIKAELTIFFTFMFFLFFSGLNHAWDALVNRNFHWQNINRPILTLLLVAGMAYPVVEAIKEVVK
jgi:hypothetical protein